MRRIFLIAGMAIWFLSCSNNGNDSSGNDTSANNVNKVSPYTMDTVNRGYNADSRAGMQDTSAGGGSMQSGGNTSTSNGKDTANQQR